MLGTVVKKCKKIQFSELEKHRVLYGRAEIWNFFSSVEKYFTSDFSASQQEKRKFHITKRSYHDLFIT